MSFGNKDYVIYLKAYRVLRASRGSCEMFVMSPELLLVVTSFFSSTTWSTELCYGIKYIKIFFFIKTRNGCQKHIFPS